MSESKSTSTSLDIYSIKFIGCRDVYPIKILRPLCKGHINNREQFNSVLKSISNANLKIHSIVADNPKRSFMKDCLQFSAKFGCEYCFECGISFQSEDKSSSELVTKLAQQKKEILEQIEKLNEERDGKKKEYLQNMLKNVNDAEKLSKTQRIHSHVVWPASTFNGEPRTKDKILDIVAEIEAGNELDQSQRKGIKGRSPLLEIDYFDFVGSVPTEYMHLVSLGGVKRLLELCFSVGEKRTRVTKRPLTSPDVFNELMKIIKVTKEFSRRARKLDFAVLKAQELRNILILFFPLITKCLQGSEKEIKVWEMFAFMVRACILPEIEFQQVNVNQINYCQKNFYALYEQLYGTKNCTYSIHVISSHMQNMRSLGPLTETSAFIFESFYAEIRRAFQPGTVSVVKQMFQTVLLRRTLSNHVCEEKIYLRVKSTPLECNSLIYVYENNTHVVYEIQSIENDILTCHQLGNLQIDLQCTNMLDWSTVGVYRKGGLSSVDVIVHRDQVAGKVLKVDNYLITCPNSILREK